MKQSVFERYGGFAFARKIVSAFYDRAFRQREPHIVAHHA